MTVLAVLAGLLGGFWAGFALGDHYLGRPRAFWSLNGAFVAACMVAQFAGLVLGWPALSYGALGVMGGSLTGLKYGYSESIGLWRVIDQMTGIEPPTPAEESMRNEPPPTE